MGRIKSYEDLPVGNILSAQKTYSGNQQIKYCCPICGKISVTKSRHAKVGAVYKCFNGHYNATNIYPLDILKRGFYGGDCFKLGYWKPLEKLVQRLTPRNH